MVASRSQVGSSRNREVIFSCPLGVRRGRFSLLKPCYRRDWSFRLAEKEKHTSGMTPIRSMIYALYPDSNRAIAPDLHALPCQMNQFPQRRTRLSLAPIHFTCRYSIWTRRIARYVASNSGGEVEDTIRSGPAGPVVGVGLGADLYSTLDVGQSIRLVKPVEWVGSLPPLKVSCHYSPSPCIPQHFSMASTSNVRWCCSILSSSIT